MCHPSYLLLHARRLGLWMVVVRTMSSQTRLIAVSAKISFFKKSCTLNLIFFFPLSFKKSVNSYVQFIISNKLLVLHCSCIQQFLPFGKFIIVQNVSRFWL